MGKSLKQLKAELLRDPETRRSYDELAPEYAVARGDHDHTPDPGLEEETERLEVLSVVRLLDAGEMRDAGLAHHEDRARRSRNNYNGVMR